MAPIDIVIDIIKHYKDEAEAAYNSAISENDGTAYYQGRFEAYRDLLYDFEGFKKLFS